MYDGVVKSYAEGKCSKQTLREMLWTMGASSTEIYFLLEVADQMRESNKERKKEEQSEKDGEG